MADQVNILSQAIEDQKSKIAVRQLERLLQSAMDRIKTLEQDITNISTGVGAVNSVTGIGAIHATPTTGNVVLTFTGVTSVTAGSAFVTVAPTTGGVVVDVNPSLFGSATGTVNRVAKFTATHTLGDSSTTDDGTTVAVGANLTVSGNATIGDDYATDAHTVNGTLAVFPEGINNHGLVVHGGGIQSATDIRDVWIAGDAVLPNGDALARSHYSLYSNCTPTRSIGELVGDVTLYAGYFNAATTGLSGSSTKVAYALYTNNGLVNFNGAVTMVSGFTSNANSSMGSNKITALANGTNADDAAAFGQIGSAITAAVSGTPNKVAKFTAANVVGDSSITDTGTAVSTASSLTVTGATTFTSVAGTQAKVTGASTSTSLGNHNVAFRIQNSDTTTNNWEAIVFDNGGSAMASIEAQNVNIASHYADINFATRAADGYLVRQKIASNGNITIGNAATNAHTINGTVTDVLPAAGEFRISGADAAASGRKTLLRLYNNATSTSGDASVIQWNIGNNVDVYNVWIGAKNTGTNPGFLNPKFIVAVQDNNTTGTASTTERLTVTNSGADVVGNLTVSNNATLGDATTDVHTVHGKLTSDSFIRVTTTSGSDGVIIGTSSKQWDWYPSGSDLKLWEFTTTQEAGGGADRLTIAAGGLVTIPGSLTVNGNVTMGDASTDAHTLNGTLTFSNAPSAGSIKVGSVQAYVSLGRQIFTANGTYTPTTGTKAVRIRMVGAGGGGGGTSGGGGLAYGGGGASGTYFELFVSAGSSVTGGAVTVGAAGAAGSSGGGTGGTGGDTSVVINGTTYTAKGGPGGAGMLNGTTSLNAVAGTKAAGSSSGDVVWQAAGLDGHRITSLGGAAGNGASSFFGGGGRGNTTGGAGGDGDGKGAGGGGSASAATSFAGGAGTAGLVIIEEYA